MGVGVGGEFVVAAAKVLDEGMPGSDHLGGAETFQPPHRPQPGLESAVIRRDEVQPLTAGQARRVLTLAVTRRNGARWSVAVALGLRQGEALGLP